jgi:hypothetical protein
MAILMQAGTPHDTDIFSNVLILLMQTGVANDW